jgi:trk system potassium uptake protein TrkA
VNDPRNQEHFDLLGVAPTVCATESILSLIEHEVPQHSLVHLFSLRRENLDIMEIGVVEESRADGAALADLTMPPGTLVISVLRNRVGRVAASDTVLAAGDQVVVIAEPGQESALMEIFASE